MILVFLGAALAGAATYAAVKRGGEEPPARPAATILAEFEAQKSPGFSLKHSNEEFERILEEVVRNQCALAWELYRGHPFHPEVPRLLFARWMNQLNYYEEPLAVYEEARAMLEERPNEPLEHTIRMVLADAASRCEAVPFPEARERVEWVLEHARKDDVPGWASGIVHALASQRSADPMFQREMLGRASALAGRLGEETERSSLERILRRLGTSLDLDFVDALTGRRWSLAEHAGSDVLIHIGWLDRWEVQQTGEDPIADELVGLRPGARDLGIHFVTINRTDEPDASVSVARARSRRIDWPVWNEPSHPDDEWAWNLGINESDFYLWVGADGRLAGACARPQPLLESIARARGRR
jgi:hypothetical protein